LSSICEEGNERPREGLHCTKVLHRWGGGRSQESRVSGVTYKKVYEQQTNTFVWNVTLVCQ